MESLSQRDLKALLEFLRECYINRDLEELASYLVLAIPTIVPCDYTAYGEIVPPRRRFKFLVEPSEVLFPGWEEVFREHLTEHPFARKYRGGGNGEAVKITDVVTLRQFRNTGLYSEFFHPVGVDHEMVVWFPTPKPVEITLALHRTRRDFTERDRHLLNLLRPHLIQAYRNAVAVSGMKLEPRLKNEPGIGRRESIVLNLQDQINFATSGAAQLLVEYFGNTARRENRLPETLAGWLREEERKLAGSAELPAARTPLILKQAGKELVIRLLDEPLQRRLLLEEHNPAPRSRQSPWTQPAGIRGSVLGRAGEDKR